MKRWPVRANEKCLRDHELRFTVHESPDYFKLKVSVFNDDKKTDLIGETWVDLNSLIIPGGSQNDHWHPLQCRGKYAGDVRIEMTYYDTRRQDEAVIERRKEAAERVQGKTSNSTSSGLAGPRQLEKVKRRPLPTDPSGATPPRPPAPEHVQSAPPLRHPMPSWPATHDHTQTTPPAAGPDSLPYAPVHSEPSFDAPCNVPAPSMHPRGAYDGPDDYQREWSVPAPALPPAGMMRRNTHETPYPDHDMPENPYDPRPLQPRRQSDYDLDPSRDYRSTSEPPFGPDMHGRMQYDAGHQPQDPFNQMVSPQYNVNPMTFGQVSTFSPRSSGHVDEPSPLSYGRPGSSSGPADDFRYQPHVRALQPIARRDDYHPEYATMQPRVEDEEEDAPPPPPPVHRSRTAQQAQIPVSPSSSYTPYTPGHTCNPSMPASLVAGYGPEGQTDRPGFQDRNGRRHSAPFDDDIMITHPSAPAPAPAPVPYEAPVYPLRTSPQPMNERPGSMASRGGSASPDTRIMTRKSVSPQPSSSSDRGASSIPFSPDSYNSLNPHASPAYETQSQARDAPIGAEIEPVRSIDQPIIGDDGREIDPSDHLPTDTWAPEPERKNRKPEVIIRFKHSPRPTSRGNDTPPRNTPPRVGFRTTPDTYGTDRPSKRYTPTHVHPSSDSVDRAPPRVDRGHERYGGYTHGRGYSTPTSADRPRSSRQASVSPTPSSRSPLYEYSSGPPIPCKVPTSHGSPAYPIASSNSSSGRPGMDALSRELSTIDIGSVGCSPSRAARKYAPPRPSASMGYAS